MEVPFYKKFLSGALIFLGIFAVGLGGGYALERAQMSGQRASVSNATTDGIYNINANRKGLALFSQSIPSVASFYAT